MAMTFQEAIEDVHKRMNLAMETAVTMISADTKLLCPVDSGTLKRSYIHDVQVDESNSYTVTGAVGTNVEYAPFVDKKKPHLSKAVDMNKKRIEDEFEKILTPKE